MSTGRVATITEAGGDSRHWLFKTEPSAYSIDDLATAAGPARWDGIRNHQARNLLRDQVGVGDGVLIYHSSCNPAGIAGVAEVVQAAYADPSQFDPASKYFDARATPAQPRWFCVDLRFVRRWPRLLTLAEIRAQAEQQEVLRELVLLKQGRLSIQPVAPPAWRALLALADRPPT